jgi:hypothetical protein
MRLPCVLLSSVTLASCAPTPVTAAAAKKDFASTHSCPAHRLDVTEEEDLSPRELATKESSPPPEIASDPERREMYLAPRTRSWEREGDVHLYTVEGCDHRSLIACGRRGRFPGYVSCTTLESHDLAFEAQMKQWQDKDDELTRQLCSEPLAPREMCSKY